MRACVRVCVTVQVVQPSQPSPASAQPSPPTQFNTYTGTRHSLPSHRTLCRALGNGRSGTSRYPTPSRMRSPRSWNRALKWYDRDALHCAKKKYSHSSAFGSWQLEDNALKYFSREDVAKNGKANGQISVQDITDVHQQSYEKVRPPLCHLVCPPPCRTVFFPPFLVASFPEHSRRPNGLIVWRRPTPWTAAFVW